MPSWRDSLRKTKPLVCDKHGPEQGCRLCCWGCNRPGQCEKHARGALMDRRWKWQLVSQERGTDGPDLEEMRRAAQGYIPLRMEGVTLELWCNGERVFALHSPALRTGAGEMYTVTMVGNNFPLDALMQDMEARGLA